jgi:hypothetical protein
VTEKKWVYVVDHRSPRESEPHSFANFIYPNQAEEMEKGYLTAGAHGADFGELRALEQSTLDSELDYGGVLHYRRALLLSDIDISAVEAFSTPEGHFVPFWSWVESSALGWTDQKLVELGQNHQTLLPDPINVMELGAANLFDQYVLSHEPGPLLDLEKSWKGASDFIKFLKTETKLIPFNIILTTKEIRSKWFEWLMGIINPLEDKFSYLSSDPQEKRWPGYLAERLSTYYWNEHLNEIKPRFLKTLRLDIAAEVVNCPDLVNYSEFLNNARRYFVLKTESQASVEALKIELALKKQELSTLKSQHQAVQESLSWKLTAPVRNALRIFMK